MCRQHGLHQERQLVPCLGQHPTRPCFPCHCGRSHRAPKNTKKGKQKKERIEEKQEEKRKGNKKEKKRKKQNEERKQDKKQEEKAKRGTFQDGPKNDFSHMCFNWTPKKSDFEHPRKKRGKK